MNILISDNLYEELMVLCETDEGFYSIDHTFQGRDYRVFAYRLVSYTTFHELPSALNCRGTTFDVTDDSMPILVSLPPHKFFNLQEGSRDETIDYENDIKSIMVKEDGSLISTVRVDGSDTILKSKTSFKSDQAVAATAWMNDNIEFKKCVNRLVTWFDLTINMEWVSPDNQIVLPYKEGKLVILNIRDHYGNYVDVVEMYGLGDYLVETFTVKNNKTFIERVVDMCPNDTDTLIEGFVVNLNGGDMVKLKTARYLRLHHTKDNIANDRRLFDVVLRQEHDDLMTLLSADPISIDRITQMERFVIGWYNSWIADVEQFHCDNKTLNRKDFAIKGQSELSKMEFTYAMQLYQNKTFDVITFICKHTDDILSENGYEYIPEI